MSWVQDVIKSGVNSGTAARGVAAAAAIGNAVLFGGGKNPKPGNAENVATLGRVQGTNTQTTFIQKNTKRSLAQRKKNSKLRKFRESVREAQYYDEPIQIMRMDSYKNFSGPENASVFISTQAGTDGIDSFIAGSRRRLEALIRCRDSGAGASIGDQVMMDWISSSDLFEVHNPNNFPLEYTYYHTNFNLRGNTTTIEEILKEAYDEMINSTGVDTGSFKGALASVRAQVPQAAYTAHTSYVELDAPVWFYLGQLSPEWRAKYTIRKKENGIIAPGDTIQFRVTRTDMYQAENVNYHLYDTPKGPNDMLWRFVAPFTNKAALDTALAGRPEFDVTIRHYGVDKFREVANPSVLPGVTHVVTQTENTRITDPVTGPFDIVGDIQQQLADEGDNP